MLYKIGLSEDILAPLTASTPKEQCLPHPKSGLNYISTATVINRLNLAFSHNWDWVDLEFWTTGVKSLEGDQILHCKGTLVVKLYDDNGKEHIIKRTGLGGHNMRMGFEEAYKSASSYALKKAASTFGIGLDLSMKEEEKLFNQMENQAEINKTIRKNTIWTEEKKKEYASYWQLIEERSVQYGATSENVDQLVSAWSHGRFPSILSLDETNFVAFCTSFNEAYPAKQAS